MEALQVWQALHLKKYNKSQKISKQWKIQARVNKSYSVLLHTEFRDEIKIQ